MSLTKKDRKLRSISGKDFSARDGSRVRPFAQLIADALLRDFGATNGAVKTVAIQTERNERAVKNWFSAKNSPSGQNLVDLIRISDAVLETVLIMCGREELVINNRLFRSRQILIQMLNLIGDSQQAAVQPHLAQKRDKGGL